MDDKNLTRLKSIGFTLVGVWKRGEDGIFFELNARGASAYCQRFGTTDR